MLEQKYFYFDMIRKYIVAFSYIVSDINFVRYNEDGTPQKSRLVPYTYAAKTKLFYKAQRKEIVKEKINKVYPMISFVLNKMTLDEERLSNEQNQNIIGIDNGVESAMDEGVPYDFNVDVRIKAKYLDDMFQIVEQIAVLFKSDYIFTLNEVNSLGVRRNISFLLNDINLPEDYDFADSDNRTILESNLNFTIKGYLYKPAVVSNVITKIELRFQSQKLVDVDTRWNHIINADETENLTYQNE